MPAVLVFAVFLIATALAVPIGIAMVAGSLAPIVFAGSGGSIPQLINNAFSGANSTPILAVPLFIFGGIIMAEGGISKKLFNFFAFFGPLPWRRALRGYSNLSVLRSYFRFRSRNGCSGRRHVRAVFDQLGL